MTAREAARSLQRYSRARERAASLTPSYTTGWDTTLVPVSYDPRSFSVEWILEENALIRMRAGVSFDEAIIGFGAPPDEGPAVTLTAGQYEPLGWDWLLRFAEAALCWARSDNRLPVSPPVAIRLLRATDPENKIRLRSHSVTLYPYCSTNFAGFTDRR